MDGSMYPIPPFHDDHNNFMFFDELYGHDSLLFHGGMDHHHHHQYINTDLPFTELSMLNQFDDLECPRQVNLEMGSWERDNKNLTPSSNSDCQNWPSSSSLSLSMDLINANIPDVSDQIPAAGLDRHIPLSTSYNNNSNINVIHDQAIEALRKTRNPRFLKPEEEHEVMTRAILAVLSNPNSSSSPMIVASQSVSSPSSSTAFMRTPDFSRQQRVDDEMHGGQLHHSMCERRRREKLNENFQTLRSLLPPSTKKDKVSVLSCSVDHLTSLISQISELTTTNHNLEAELLLRTSPNLPRQRLDKKHIMISNGVVNIRVSDVAESSSSKSRSRMIDLQVSTGRDYSILDLSIRILELLEQTPALGLVSFDTKTLTIGLNPMNVMILRLNIISKDEKWDEGSFKEAVRKAVAELAVIST